MSVTAVATNAANHSIDLQSGEVGRSAGATDSRAPALRATGAQIGSVSQRAAGVPASAASTASLNKRVRSISFAQERHVTRIGKANAYVLTALSLVTFAHGSRTSNDGSNSLLGNL